MKAVGPTRHHSVRKHFLAVDVGMKFHSDFVALFQRFHEVGTCAESVNHKAIGRNIHIASGGRCGCSHHLEWFAKHKRFAVGQLHGYLGCTCWGVGIWEEVLVVDYQAITATWVHQVHAIHTASFTRSAGCQTREFGATDNRILFVGIEHKLGEIGVGVRLVDFTIHHAWTNGNTHPRIATTGGA